jgi:outer membrane immunogenic protein
VNQRSAGRFTLCAAGAALVAGVALGAAPAWAADAVVGEAPPSVPMEEPPVASWAGTYVGVVAGYGFAGKVETEENEAHTEGFAGGAFAGVQGQSDAIVYGVEGDIGYSGVDGDNDGVKVDGGVEGSLRARLGYTVTPDVMIYGTAGGAAQKLTVREDGAFDDKAMVGYTVGAGTDFKITDNVFGRVEYRYTDFGSKNFDLGSGSADVDNSNHRIMFGVGMGF